MTFASSSARAIAAAAEAAAAATRAASSRASLPPASASFSLPLDYRACPCLGVPPGRACRHCGSTRWQRRCGDCLGSGLLHKHIRTGTPGLATRAERCGRCMGAGWTPCPMAEVRLAEAGAKEAAAAAAAKPSELASAVAAAAAAAAAVASTLPAPPPGQPSPEARKARVSTRRKQIKHSKEVPVRRYGRARVSIAAERPQNPLEAVEIEHPEDNPRATALAPQAFDSADAASVEAADLAAARAAISYFAPPE